MIQNKGENQNQHSHVTTTDPGKQKINLSRKTKNLFYSHKVCYGYVTVDININAIGVTCSTTISLCAYLYSNFIAYLVP